MSALIRRSLSRIASRRSKRGFTLAMCAVLITLMSIAVAVALPRWSTQIRREKEAELIFRGLQMAEGIRVFQKRFGRYPVRLQELWETEPRSVRQAWKDPMTESGRWRPVLQVAAGVPGAVPGAIPGLEEDDDEDDENEDGTGEGDEQPEEPVNPEQGIPILGVSSRGKGEALRTFFGQNQVYNWKFTVDLVTPGPPAGQPAGVPGQPGQPTLRIPNADNIGRPLPGGGGPGTMPGSGLPGGPVGVPGGKLPPGKPDSG